MKLSKSLSEKIKSEIKEIVNSQDSLIYKMESISQLLEKKIDHYDWVGFYLVDENSPRKLILGPFVGEPTEHTRINFGDGICGQAAEREETFVVQDVSKENNYLSCSPVVKSEIVVPILKDNKVVGELDIDSHSLSPFSKTDTELLEYICRKLSDCF